MKKSDLIAMLRDVKSGAKKIDDVITAAETSRRGLVWADCAAGEKMSPDWIYRVDKSGKMSKIPVRRNGYIFQPYYRSIASMEKQQKIADEKRRSKK